jgi:3-oxoacyl-(acyl-carrier-protein) synthase III
VRIISAGTFTPERRVTNDEVEARISAASPKLKLRKGLIKARTGILERRYMSDDMQASDLGVQAALRAMKQAGAAPGDIDLLIWGSASQDMVEPATAHIVAHKLGLDCAVFDVKNACNSWLNAMQTATALITSGRYRTALIVTGESPSRAIRWSVDSYADLFNCAAGYTMGDAGAAVFLAYDPSAEGMYFQDFRAASRHWSIATLPGGGSQHPRGDEFTYFTGDGGRLRDAFVDLGPDIVHEALEATGTSFDDYARVFCHQVTMPFLEVFLDSTKIPIDKLTITVPKLGNIAAATMPTQLAMSLADGTLQEGDQFCFVGLGGGLTLGVAMGVL